VKFRFPSKASASRNHIALSPRCSTIDLNDGRHSEKYPIWQSVCQHYDNEQDVNRSFEVDAYDFKLRTCTAVRTLEATPEQRKEQRKGSRKLGLCARRRRSFNSHPALDLA
jgi:hypothetical protein